MRQAGGGYPRLLNALFLAALFIAAQLLAGSVTGAIIGSAPLSNGLRGSLVSIASFLLVMQFVRYRAGFRLKGILGGKRIPLLVLPGALVACLGAVLAVNGIDRLLETLLPMPAPLSSFFASLKDPGDLAGSVLLLCVAAPITEEVLFRGVILTGFLDNYKPLEALLLSSWLFAFIHLNPWQFPTAFLLGMLLGLLYMRSGSIIPSIVCHALFNCLTNYSERILPSLGMPAGSAAETLGAVGGAAMAAIGVLLMLRGTRARR
jgi:uncharacterized protein